MTQKMVYVVIAAIVVAVAVVSYMLYQERQSGVEIEIGQQGIKIEGN